MWRRGKWSVTEAILKVTDLLIFNFRSEMGCDGPGWCFCLLRRSYGFALSRDAATLAHDAAAEYVNRGVVFSRVISDGVFYPRWVR